MDQTVNTVPDEHLTITDLLYRHSRGLPVESRVGEYFDNLEIPRFSDITEVHEFFDRNKQRYQQLTEDLNAQKQALKNSQNAKVKDVTPTPPTQPEN